jgi:beta-barrel assembly-enhancing protease
MERSSRRKFLSLACKWGILSLGAAPVLSSFISGCKTLDTLAKSGPSFQVGDVVVDTKAIAKETQVVTKSFEDITPQQEYYIGRTVGAMILQKYPPYNNPTADGYVNVMGQMLAQASDCPETYGGYHFLIQDSDEINAFAAPGGLIFLTRGMLRCCPQEDAVAAVLAHEIGHVQYKHGLRAIKQSRVTSALTALAIKGAKKYGDEDLAKLTETFEGSISDITKTLIVNGYSRSFENQADLAAISILQRTGYDPNGLVMMLNQMKTQLKPGRQDFAATHPTPDSRLAEIQKYVGKYSAVKSPQARQDRFKTSLGKI